MSAVVQMTLPEFDQRAAAIVQSFGNTRVFAPVWPQIAQMAVSDVKKNFVEQHAPNGQPWAPLAHGRPGQPTGAWPLRDSGLLLASINGRADEKGITIGSNLEYAKVHQYGHHMVPKRAKFLAIPLTIEAKRAGSPRNFPGNPQWRFLRTKTGGWLMMAASMPVAQQRNIAIRRLEGRRLTAAQHYATMPVPQYVLVSSVDIPARPFLGFSPYLLDRIGFMLMDVAGRIAMDGLRNIDTRRAWTDFLGN